MKMHVFVSLTHDLINKLEGNLSINLPWKIVFAFPCILLILLEILTK